MTKLRILVVEDELLIADFIAAELEDAGHEVLAIARTVNEATASLATAQPDLILCDIMLKDGQDGIDFIRDLARRGTQIPHFFISGSGEPETRRRAEATGPLGFLQKPFSGSKLLATLSSLPLARR